MTQLVNETKSVYTDWGLSPVRVSLEIPIFEVGVTCNMNYTGGSETVNLPRNRNGFRVELLP